MVQIFYSDAQKQAALAKAKKAAPKVQAKAGNKAIPAKKNNNNTGNKKNNKGPAPQAVGKRPIVIVKPKSAAGGVVRPNSARPKLQVNLGTKKTAPQAPAAANKKPAANKPAQQQQQHTSTPILSIKTAEAIARDSSHPKRNEVAELLKTYERGWIDSNKFHNLLQKMIV